MEDILKDVSHSFLTLRDNDILKVHLIEYLKPFIPKITSNDSIFIIGSVLSEDMVDLLDMEAKGYIRIYTYAYKNIPILDLYSNYLDV